MTKPRNLCQLSHVAVIQAEVSDANVARATWAEWTEELARVQGWLGAVGGLTTDDRCVGVFKFSSSEHGRQWVSPRGGDLWNFRRRDSADVEILLNGGNPNAGFVQVMQARVRDRSAFAVVNEQLINRFAQFRRDFLGTVHIWDPDGTLTVVDSFTNEREARAGERSSMPADLQILFDAWMDQLYEDIWYDLADPWFAWPSR